MPARGATAPLPCPAGPVPRALASPHAAPHVLDATMFWSSQATGGVRRVLCAKRQHLIAAGWRHTLLVPDLAGDPVLLAASAQDAGQVLCCGGLRLPRSGGYRFVLDRAGAVQRMVQARPDVIEAADPYVLGWGAREAAQRLGIPAVAFCHSHLPALLERWAHATLGRHAARWAAQRARRYLVALYGGFDAVLAPSPALVAQLQDWGLPQADYQPLGVDGRIFRPAAHPQTCARWLKQALGVHADTRLLLYCGRFAPEKRLPLLAAAVRALGPGHLLVCVGAGPCVPEGPQVRVLPPEREPARLAQLMASCDAFVHAGDQETFGLAALEAMACGVPVVLCDQAGLGELGADLALTVRGDRPGVWAEAMRAALDAPDPARRQRALARARALDWTAVTALMRQRYAALLQGRRPAEAAPAPAPATDQDRPPSSASLDEAAPPSAAAYSLRRL